MSNKPENTERCRCLLIGKEEKVFLHSKDGTWDFCYCDNILDGIQAAATNPFDILFVQLGCIEGIPLYALETLRQVSSNGLIILLVQMTEEPLAVKLIRQSGPSAACVNDYIVCPIRHSDLVRFTEAVTEKKRKTSDIFSPEKQHLEKRIRELEALVVQDDLTGLKNRRYLNQFLGQILRLAEKKRFRVTLLLFDIDNFKQYNDLYGHTVGDRVLQQAAQLMQRCCRAHDVVARIGGDEFAVVFWDLPPRSESAQKRERRLMSSTHPKEPLFMAERFRREINSANLSFLGPHGKGILTISGGLAAYPEDAGTPSHLFEQADYALLEAKKIGKNRLVLVGNLPGTKPSLSTEITRPAAGTR